MNNQNHDPNDSSLKGDSMVKSFAPIIGQLGVILAILAGAAVIAASIIFGAVIMSKRNVQPAQHPANVGLQSGNDLAQNTDPVNIELLANVPYLGKQDAPVTIIEYADFQCPFCKRWQEEIFPKIKEQYIDTGKVKFVYQNFAFLGEESQFAAEAASCAYGQGKFWEMHDALFAGQGDENSGVFSVANLKTIAKNNGLNMTKFNQCIDGRINKAAVESEIAKAQGYGIDSTPSIFVNGIKIQGVQPFSVYAQTIDRALNPK